MFTIPVGDILASYTGDSKQFSFSGEIFDGFYDDILFLHPLEFDIKMFSLEDGVEVFFTAFCTKIEYEGKTYNIEIPHFERTWKTHIDPLHDGDDIGKVDPRSMTIDLAPVIREEIIMVCHEL